MAFTRITMLVRTDEPLSQEDLTTLAGGLTGNVTGWLEHGADAEDGEVVVVVVERVDGEVIGGL